MVRSISKRSASGCSSTMAHSESTPSASKSLACGNRRCTAPRKASRNSGWSSAIKKVDMTNYLARSHRQACEESSVTHPPQKDSVPALDDSRITPITRLKANSTHLGMGAVYLRTVPYIDQTPRRLSPCQRYLSMHQYPRRESVANTAK